MRFLMLAMFAGATAACASAPPLSQAIIIHNTTKHVVQAADLVLKPVYDQAAEAADAQFPDDAVAYKQAMSPYDEMLGVLQQAAQVERALHLAVEQWQVGADDGRMTNEAAACAGDTLTALGQQAVALDNQVGNWVYASALTLSFQLFRLADGAECGVTP